MVASNFPPSLACALVHEGGKDDDPRDPGGRTAYGVTQTRYNQYRRARGRPTRDVWLIEPAERTEIYKTYYWDVVQGDLLPAGLDYAVFDGAVNSGDVQAAKWLQRAINEVSARMGLSPITVDGRIRPGGETLQRLAEIEDHDAIISAMQDRRLAMLKNLRTWAVFGRGWGRRVAEVRKLGVAVARGSIQAPAPAGWILGEAKGKALISDAKTLPSPTKGAVASAAGTITAGSAAVTPSLTSAQGLHPTLDTIIQCVIIAGAVAGAAGALWALYASRRAKTMADALDIATPQAVTA